MIDMLLGATLALIVFLVGIVAGALIMLWLDRPRSDDDGGWSHHGVAPDPYDPFVWDDSDEHARYASHEHAR